MKKATNHTLDGPAFTFTGVRLTGLTVKSLFLRTLDFGIDISWRLGHSPARPAQLRPGIVRRRLTVHHEINAIPSPAHTRRGPPRDPAPPGLALRRPGGVPAGRRA